MAGKPKGIREIDADRYFPAGRRHIISRMASPPLEMEPVGDTNLEDVNQSEGGIESRYPSSAALEIVTKSILWDASRNEAIFFKLVQMPQSES